MLIIEVILIVFAWRNGWKWCSLIPMGVGMVLSFVAGFAVGMSGGTPDSMGWIAVFDVAAIVALIIMVCKKPKTSKPETKQLLND